MKREFLSALEGSLQSWEAVPVKNINTEREAPFPTHHPHHALPRELYQNGFPCPFWHQDHVLCI
jgi:hypothetical protein